MQGSQEATLVAAAVFNDTSPTRHHGCNAVMQALDAGLREQGIEPGFYWPVGVDWRPFADALMRERVDIVVVNGEGTIHHSAERERARALCAIPAFAHERLGAPAVLVNASVEALEPAALEGLRGFDAIHVRETVSRTYLESRGIEATFAPDLSFATPLPTEDRVRSGLLVTDSVSAEIAEALRSVADTVGGSFESMRHRASLLERLGRSFMKRARSGPPLRRALECTSDYRAFVERLAAKETVVTGRFHTVTLALLTATPVIAVPSNTAKIRAVLSDALGDAGRQVDMHDSSDLPGRLRARLDEGIGYDEGEREALSRYLEHARDAHARMFRSIARIAGVSGTAS